MGKMKKERLEVNQTFKWNPFSDQPDNVAPKKERFWHHFRFAPSYLSLLSSNIQKAIPVLSLYREYKKRMYKEPRQIDDPFGVSVSPGENGGGDILESLADLGIQKTLIRIPSWEKEKLRTYLKFAENTRDRGFDVIISLLQRRQDVHNPGDWEDFLDEVFGRFRHLGSFFEIGHAWNRTKWGIWDYREYLKLAGTSVLLAKRHGIKIIGPAVIDFEFHLYPVVLRKIAFDRVTSLLYVDRLGAPENTQFGWDTPRKVALLKAVVDGCMREKRDIWITEMNWPLKGREKYSPAAGRVNVTEEEQADFLIRYFILVLASGLVERIYWWQLAAPGYGLIDNLAGDWRRRPGYFALKCLVERLKNSIFLEKVPHPEAFIFKFRKAGRIFAVCWTKEGIVEPHFSRQVLSVESRDGEEIALKNGCIKIGPSPRYVYFDKHDET